MKTLLPAVLLLATAAVVCGQTQERKLMDRVTKPDLQQGNPLGDRKFQGGGSMKLDEASYAKSGYATSATPYTKEYALTRSFFGIKNPWFGNKVYDARKAGDWTTGSMYGADKKAPLDKTAQVSGFYDDNKSASLGNSVVPLRTAEIRPTSPGAMSQISESISKEMTIDQVRELLNKPR